MSKFGPEKFIMRQGQIPLLECQLPLLEYKWSGCDPYFFAFEFHFINGYRTRLPNYFTGRNIEDPPMERTRDRKLILIDKPCTQHWRHLMRTNIRDRPYFSFQNKERDLVALSHNDLSSPAVRRDFGDQTSILEFLGQRLLAYVPVQLSPRCF